MSTPRREFGQGQPDEHAEVRRQLIALISKGKRRWRHTALRPTDVRFGEIRDPETGHPFTQSTMWGAACRLLSSGAPLRKVTLDKPRGEKPGCAEPGWGPENHLSTSSFSSVAASYSFAVFTWTSMAMTRIASPPTGLRQIDGPENCEMCGSPGLKTELVRDPFVYGTGADAVELAADIPVHTCSHCDESYAGRQAEIIGHDVVCRHLGVLTADEIRRIREAYGMSRAKFARVTGLGKATLARWERREVIQNVANDRYLRLLRDPATFDRLRHLARDPATDSSPAGAAIADAFVLPTREMELFRQRGRRFTTRHAGRAAAGAFGLEPQLDASGGTSPDGSRIGSWPERTVLA